MTKNKQNQLSKKLPLLEWSNDLTEMSKLLVDDLQRVISEIATNETDQFLRRTFVRTLFAMIEGCLNAIIRAVLLFYNAGVTRLDEKEVAQLSREIDVELEDGSKNRENFHKLIDKFKFSYEIYIQKVGGENSYLFKMPQEIEKSLREMIDVRHRLMHPKLYNDLSISDEELEKLIKIAHWYNTTHVSLMMRVVSKLNERNQKIQRILDRSKKTDTPN